MQVQYDLSLAQFYMWAQTRDCIYIAVNVPTGLLVTELFGLSDFPTVWKPACPLQALMTCSYEQAQAEKPGKLDWADCCYPMLIRLLR